MPNPANALLTASVCNLLAGPEPTWKPLLSTVTGVPPIAMPEKVVTPFTEGLSTPLADPVTLEDIERMVITPPMLTFCDALLASPLISAPVYCRTLCDSADPKLSIDGP